jgi:hypothetical protein
MLTTNQLNSVVILKETAVTSYSIKSQCFRGETEENKDVSYPGYRFSVPVTSARYF